MATFPFTIFILVSLAVFLGILRLTLRRRPEQLCRSKLAAVAFVVVVLGMIFAKWGANFGLGWIVYYGAPAAVTLFMPPIAFRMGGREVLEYVLMASANAPIIHVVFSVFLGWHEYMPFIPIPSIWGDGAIF